MLTKNIFILAVLLLLIFSNTKAFSQTKRVEFTGIVKDGKNNVNDVSVVVYNSNTNYTKEGQFTTAKSSNGKFKVNLDLKKYYLIEVSKSGYVAQTIAMSTSVPDPQIKEGNGAEFVLDIDMIRMTDGLNVSGIAGIPTIKVKFIRDDGHFEKDDVYEKTIKSKVDKVKTQLADLLKKAYDKEFKEGTTFFNQKNYEEALLHYNNSLEFLPEDKEAKKKIADIEKAGTTNEKAFQKFKAQGDDGFNKKDYLGSITSFNKALAYKPNDAYVKGKIEEAKSKSQIAQNTQTQTQPQTKDKKGTFLKVTGIVFIEDKKLKDATASLFEDTKNIGTVKTDVKGEFSFVLDMNKNYTIEITKTGMVTEKVKVLTQTTGKKSKTVEWNKSFSVSLFEMVTGLNTTQLNDPVLIIKYNASTDEFDWDRTYADKMEKKVDNLIAEADKLIKAQKLADKNATAKKPETKEQPPVNAAKDVVQNTTADNKTDAKSDVPENKEDTQKDEKQEASKTQPIVKNEDTRTSAQKIDSCLNHIKQLQGTGDKKELALAYNDVAGIYYDNGDNSNAIENFEQSLKNKEELGDKPGSASALLNLGMVYNNIFRYDDALKSFNKSLKIKQDLSDKPGESKLLYRIGNVYYEKKEFEKAAEYYEKSLDLDKGLKNDKDIAASYNNLGVMFYELKNYEKSMEFYEKALKMNGASGQEKEASISLNNLGNVKYDWHKYDEALDYYEKSLKIKEKIDYKKGVAISLFNIGNVYRELAKYDKAFEYYNRSEKISKAQNYGDVLYNVYSAMSDIYALQKNCEKAFEFYKLSDPFKQYATNTGKHKQMSEMQIKYDAENLRNADEISMLKEEVAKQKQLVKEIAQRNEMELALKNTELEKKEADIKVQKTQKYASFAGILLLLLLAFILYRGYKIKKKQNEIIKKQNDDLTYANHEIMEKNEELKQQKEEITAQRDEIEGQKNIIMEQRDIATAQRDEITMQKQEITDSINYAEYIQRALLNPGALVIAALPEHFILFRPRNVVSGDFYWLGTKGNSIVIAAVDCTGHGVPGGFMSMLGVAYLNEIINKMPDSGPHSIINAGDILDQLRESVIKGLHQTGKDGESKDGMDIALCVINKEKTHINFAGAYNPMYIIKNGEISEVKADRMPIGIFIKEKTPFTNNELIINKGDKLYLFSDGFEDQFGGPRSKKFGSEPMKKILLESSAKSMNEQKELLQKSHNEWKGDSEQIDDILVIGFKV